MFESEGGAYPSEGPHSFVGSWPYPLELDLAGKAEQEKNTLA